MFVPVKSKSGENLMPTHPNKAGMLIKKGLATPYWSNGIFCIRLNYKNHRKPRCELDSKPFLKFAVYRFCYENYEIYIIYLLYQVSFAYKP